MRQTQIESLIPAQTYKSAIESTNATFTQISSHRTWKGVRCVCPVCVCAILDDLLDEYIHYDSVILGPTDGDNGLVAHHLQEKKSLK